MKTKILLVASLYLLLLPSCNKECAIPNPNCKAGYSIDNNGNCFCPKGRIEVANQCRKPFQYEWGNPNLDIPCFDHMFLQSSFLGDNDSTFQYLKDNPWALYIFRANCDSLIIQGYIAGLRFQPSMGYDFFLDFQYSTTQQQCSIGNKKARLIEMRLNQPHPDTLLGIAKYGQNTIDPPILTIPVVFYRQR